MVEKGSIEHYIRQCQRLTYVQSSDSSKVQSTVMVTMTDSDPPEEGIPDVGDMRVSSPNPGEDPQTPNTAPAERGRSRSRDPYDIRHVSSSAGGVAGESKVVKMGVMRTGSELFGDSPIVQTELLEAMNRVKRLQ